MKKIILLFTIVPLFLYAQTNISKNHASQNLTCSTCHSCEIPTKENLCLKPCPRESMIKITQTPQEGPRVITINKIKETDIYEPAVFSHLAHAEMAEMSGGCRTCHHYNPPGNVVGCSSCHETQRKREDVSKPDLKGAFHRLCIDCHRAWSGSIDCVSCHALKGKSAQQTKAEDTGAKRIHPEIKAPDKLVYNTNTAPQGKLVTFYHSEHINLFGFDCADCHTNDGCVKCHASKKVKEVKNVPVADLHKKCSKCHDTGSDKSCTNCHSNTEKGPFNHKAVTGFDNSRFHSGLKCERCHTTKSKFTGLNSECSSCHGTWTWDNFDHKVTGLVLDETHGEFECENCHKEPTYSKQTCEDCHEDKSFPKDVPGKLIRR